MELIRTIRERRQAQRQSEIMMEAEEYIRLSDFDDDMFIAYNGIPLVPIDKGWTVPQILEKLSEVRQNYMNAKTKEYRIPRIAAML